MVAQHGTLNFIDDSVFMVLSLPASAFGDADENNDGQLSLTEFAQHRTKLISVISEQVSLSNSKGKLPINGLMISPVTPHDAPKEPADQVIVMGRFALGEQQTDLRFEVGLYGELPKGKALEITATRKAKNNKQVFELSPDAPVVKLAFK